MIEIKQKVNTQSAMQSNDENKYVWNCKKHTETEKKIIAEIFIISTKKWYSIMFIKLLRKCLTASGLEQSHITSHLMPSI